MKSPAELEGILACPACKGGLGKEAGDFTCSSCGTSFPVENGVPLLLSPRGRAETAETLSTRAGRRMDSTWREDDAYLRLVRRISRVISSEFVPLRKRFIGPLEALSKEGGRILEVGSGARRLLPEVFNLDIAPFPQVDVAGMAEELPFAPAVFDAVVLEVTLEHVRDPRRAASEAVRVLKPGGRVFAVMPFVFPFHAHPSDFWRASMPGLRELFSSLKTVDSGVYHGPVSMLLNLLSDVPAGLIFPGHGKGYMAVKGLFLAPLFWLKYADYFLARLPGARHYAGTLFLIGEKA